MNNQKETDQPEQDLSMATLGGGCFWCLEAVYLELQGVDKVLSGYSGGYTVDPDQVRSRCHFLSRNTDRVLYHP